MLYLKKRAHCPVRQGSLPAGADGMSGSTAGLRGTARGLAAKNQGIARAHNHGVPESQINRPQMRTLASLGQKTGQVSNGLMEVAPTPCHNSLSCFGTGVKCQMDNH